MKKPWNAPSIETLDVRMTESGYIKREIEGTDVIFKPTDGGNEEYVVKAFS